jgi:hypothetical protein
VKLVSVSGIPRRDEAYQVHGFAEEEDDVLFGKRLRRREEEVGDGDVKDGQALDKGE